MRGTRISLIVVVLFLVVGTVAPATVAGAGKTAHQETPEASIVADEPNCSFPLTETDASGTEVTLEDEPETVVTLNPSAAQTLWEIGAEEKVIGTTKHAMNLDGAEDRTNVSTEAETIEPEIVVDLDPDLVLAPSSNYVSEETVETLREAGVTVYYFQSAESIDEVRERTLFVGSLVGECDGAEETVDWMDAELEAVADAIDGEERPDVLYTFFGHTAGEDTFIHELIEAGGGTNVAAEAGISEYPQISDETVIEQDPDWIVLNTNSPEVPDGPAYESTTAIENDQTLVVDINHLNRPGPRVVHAVTAFAETFHPEAYAEATGDEPSESANGSTADDGTGGADGVPGFGALSAVVGLCITLFVAHRTIRHGDERS
ncbi:PGF-CTERM-anchored ABC transporter substrate-binding protein [Natrialbaceae archaeon A-arb3/5]